VSFDNKIGEGKYVISVDSQGAITQLQQFDSKVKQTSQTTQTSFRQAAASAISLASGLGSLYFQYDNLEKVQLRIRKASLEVSRAQEEVNKLMQSGQRDTLDYQQAVERLEIAQERHKILVNDLQQSQIALGFSIAQTALAIPSAVKAISELTKATNLAKIAQWAQNFAMLANPLYAIPTAAAIAAAVGLVATNTWGLRDALFGSTEAVEANTDAIKAGGDGFKAYGDSLKTTEDSAKSLDNTMQKTRKTLKETNEMVEMWSRINSEALKKNEEILNANQSQINTFADLFKRQEAFSVIQEELEKRSIALALQAGYRQFNLTRNFKSAGIDINADPRLASLMSIGSQTITDVFRRLRQTGNIDNSEAYHGSFGNDFAGIPRSLAGDLINNGRVGSSRSVSGSSKARRGGFGGFKAGWGVQEVIKPFDAQINGYEAIAKQYRDMGFQIDLPEFPLANLVRGYKSPSNEFLQTSIRQSTARYDASVQRFHQQIAAAKVEIENRLMGLVSRSGLTRSEVVSLQSTQQGTDDLYGIIDYRERLARASTGTG
jgi:hypothetical protein